jgi:predicted RNase H-like nuclease
MVLIAGVDGCKGGWLCISKNLLSDEISSEVFPSMATLLVEMVKPIVLAIDIPIGLPDSGSRQCDKLARKMLGSPRASSVFPAPIRPAMKARFRKEADEITRSADGRGVGAQAWGLYTRIREVDEIVLVDPLARRCIYEVHPEVSFMYWNEGSAIVESKKSDEGMAIRTRLIDKHFGEDVRSAVLKQHTQSLVREDDVNDAFAAVWTAERIYSGSVKVIPNPPELDSMGIEMAMWY